MGRDRMGDIKPKTERDKNDFYITNPYDVKEIVNILNLSKDNYILEPCAGLGHISKTLRELGYKVFTNDLIKRDYKLDANINYLLEPLNKKFDVVLTNPPFKYAKEFIEKSFKYADIVIILAKLELLESAKRLELNNRYLEDVYVHTKRAKFGLNGDESYFKKSSSMATAWYIYNKNKVSGTKIKMEII